MKTHLGESLVKFFESGSCCVKTLDALLFFLFAFLFLGGVQVDLLQLLLYPLLGYVGVFWLRVMALVFVAALMVLHWKIHPLFRLDDRWHAFTYFPFFLLVAFVTLLSPHFLWGRGIATGVLLLVSFVVMYELARRIPRRMHLLECLLCNLFVMLASFFAVVMLGNTDDVLHYELRMERYLTQHDERKALETASLELPSSQRLLALRAYALARTHSLGDRLFEFPQVEGNTDLFLHSYDAGEMIYPLDSVKAFLGFVPVRKVTRGALQQRLKGERLTPSSPLSDYWLCTLLLQKDLPTFASSLAQIYSLDMKSVRDKLPRYYKEALVLYNSLYVHPSLVFRCAEVEGNYSDFKDLAGQYLDPVEQRNRLRRMYGNTYWWYYHYFPLQVR